MLLTHFSLLRTATVFLVLILAVLPHAQAQQGDTLTVRADSPQSYVVVEGDTLWDIAGVFLEEPWLWPEIWQVNPQIANPDLIYPGDRLELYYVDGEPRVSVQRGGVAMRQPGGSAITDTDLSLVRLSPQVRREALLSPVPAISLESISSSLSKNRILRLSALDDAPTLLASRSETQFSREGDVVFAIGNWTPGITAYEIVRPVAEIENPQTGEVIALQVKLIGRASMLDNNNGQATLIINNNIEEVREGDYFVVGESMTLASRYFPAAPAFDVDARIVDIDFGRSTGGKNATVIVDLGEVDQIKAGDLLSLQKEDSVVRDPTVDTFLRIDTQRANLTFSGEIYGRILIYKVFEKHSFALVLSSDLPIRLNDKVITP